MSPGNNLLVARVRAEVTTDAGLRRFTDLLLRRMRSVAMAMTSPRISSTVALGSLATSSVESRFQFFSST